MQVILQEDISTLGKAGEVVTVKPGYARNFLLPRGKAVSADANNLKALEHHRKAASAKQAKLKAEAEKHAATMKGVQVTITAEVGEEGKLFGSITSGDIVAALKALGHTVEKTQVQLREHLKQVGAHTVEIKLLADVSVPVIVNVVPRAK